MTKGTSRPIEYQTIIEGTLYYFKVQVHFELYKDNTIGFSYSDIEYVGNNDGTTERLFDFYEISDKTMKFLKDKIEKNI